MSSLIEGFDAKELVHQGWTHYKVDQSLIDDANAEVQCIINTFKTFPAEERELVRPGEKEADIGLIRKHGKNGSDDKFFFHYSCDFFQSGSRLRSFPTPALSRLYDCNRRAAVTITSHLSDSYPELFSPGLSDSLWQGATQSIAYGTSALRGLYYPQTVGAPKVQGAQKHVDRGFVTQHQGDAGGELIAFGDELDEVGSPVSPGKGETLVFFGVKVLYVTGGKIKPLWHGSRTKLGVDRRALVQFEHVDVGFAVTNAAEAYRQFYAEAA